MQHVYGRSGNLGNECADHAAALGSRGLHSYYNLASRWVRHNFDTVACCGGCNRSLGKLRGIGTEAASLPLFFIGFSVTFTHALQHM